MNSKEDFYKLKLSDEIYDSLTYNHQPYVATFELTPRCNFRCIHCYLGVHRKESELNFEQIKYILDQLKENGVIQIALTGGECLLREDFCKIYRYAKESGFIVSVFSNLSVLTGEALELFKELPPYTIEVSVYGNSEETYRKVTGMEMYENVVRNLDELHKNHINFSLKTPFMIQNILDKEGIETLAKKYGKELRVGAALSPTIDRELYPEDFQIDLCQQFMLEVGKNTSRKLNVDVSETINMMGDKMDCGEECPLFICNPGVTDVFVDYQGRVCPCIGYRSKGVSLLEKNFQEIWSSFTYLKDIPAPNEYRCVRCESRYFCPICIGEQDEVYGDTCHIPVRTCILAHAKKMYYVDKESVDNIVSYIMMMSDSTENGSINRT